MLRWRRLKVAYLLGSLLLLTASLHAPTAYAAAGDPPTGSPAGSIYKLPLEQGRADGAPKGGGGTSSGNGSGGGSTGAAATRGEAGSLYRSENNFGSSSRVPGAAGNGGAGTAGSSGGANAAGTGGGARAGAAGGALAAGTAGQLTESGNTSLSASIFLLAAIAVLAAAVGVLSRRATRRRAAS